MPMCGEALARLALVVVLPFAVFAQNKRQPSPTPSPTPCAANDSSCMAAKTDAITEKADKAATKADAAATKLDSAADKLNSAAKDLDTTVQNAAAAKDSADKAAEAKTGAETAKSDSEKAAQRAKDSAEKAAASGVLQRLAQRKGRPKNPPLNDYVPCIFGGDEDFNLRARPNPFRGPDDPITEEEAQKIEDGIMATVQKLREAGILNDDDVKWLKAIADLKVPEIVGLTPKEATQQLVAGINQAMQDLKKSKKNQAMQDLKKDQESSPSNAQPLNPKATQTDSQNAQTKIEQDFKLATNKMTKSAEASVHEVAAPTTFNRPDDVVCSFSLMGWEETKDVFGRRVADKYVAIQLNVRNLSKDNEFLIHDIQIAVDTGVNPRQFARFQTGRDRVIVRAVAQRGQSEDRRNLILNTMQMLGSIAGGASAAFTSATSDDANAVSASTKLSTAVELFQGPFLTGLANIFPDHTLEHINRISDLAFSASSTNKTVIPIQGAVPLVTFLTERPLEQLPFSRCGTTIRSISIGDTWGPHIKGEYQDDDESKKNAVNQKDPGHVKYRFCVLEPDENDDSTATNNPEPDAYTKALHYKKWKPAALKVLEHRTYVVVAGVHIQEVSNSPTVTAIRCQLAGEENVVDLSKADKDGNISCNLEGKHLDKAESARLVFKDKSIGATIEADSDGNTGTLTFPANAFSGKNAPNGDYKLFIKDKAGNDNDSKQSIKFGVRGPQFTQVSPTTLPKTAPALKIAGKNLDRITAITLITDSPKKGTQVMGTIDNQTNNSLGVTFNVEDIKNLAGDAHVEFKTQDDDISHKDDTKITIPKQ